MTRRNRLPLSLFADMTDLEIAAMLLDYDRALWPLDGVDDAISLIEAAEEVIALQDEFDTIDEACAAFKVSRSFVEAVGGAA